MIVAFHSHTMTFRGSENALWDYADFNETILGNQSVICHQAQLGVQDNPVFAKCKNRFPLVSLLLAVGAGWALAQLGGGCSLSDQTRLL